MLHRRLLVLLILGLAWTPGFASTALAQTTGRVELIVVTERGGSLTAPQDWARALGAAGVENVRIRGQQPGDEPGIAATGTKERPTYVVTGVLNGRDELVVPGKRFSRGQAPRLARWLKELAAQGPPEQREKTVAFGLTLRQFDHVHADLARPVDFTTKDQTRRQVVEQIGRRLAGRLSIDPEILQRLGDGKLSTELEGISCGTALAYTLRSSALCLMPHPMGEQPPEVEYTVIAMRPDVLGWPVGRPPERSRHEDLPAMFESLNVNVQGVPVTKVLQSVAERLKAPVLLDEAALARWEIDPDRIQATLPQQRTTYSVLLQRVLFQAGLTNEIRVDEAGRPFLWVTTLKSF